MAQTGLPLVVVYILSILQSPGRHAPPASILAEAVQPEESLTNRARFQSQRSGFQFAHDEY